MYSEYLHGTLTVDLSLQPTPALQEASANISEIREFPCYCGVSS